MIIPVVLTSIVISCTICEDFFDNYTEITQPPPESIEALPKCGEGPQRGKFKCVPYFNCDSSTNTIVAFPEVDGSNVSRPRSSYSDPLCPHYLQVCCRVPNGTSSTVQHGPTINSNFQSKCGSRNPWTVALFNGSKPFCGGSLLSPTAVLTAAHCIEHLQVSQITIRAGIHQDRKISEIIVHEHYLWSTLYNDVAILILNESLSQATDLGTVCLTTSLGNISLDKCLVTSWGQLESSSDKLRKIRVSTMASNKCEENLRKLIGNDFLLDRSFICALENSNETICKGDGGAPLVCPDSAQTYYQVGIVSWGVSCNGEDPGVYTNVALFKDWIDYKLIELGYQSSSYTAS